MQTAWNYMNDSLRTVVFMKYDPETIASACIHLSAKLLQIPLPNNPAWFLVFGVLEQDINDISHIILSLYGRRKPDPDRLEKLVEELRKSHQEAKMKAKGVVALNNLMASSSQPSSPRNGIKSPGTDGKKYKSDKRDLSPRTLKELQMRKRVDDSPLEDGYGSPPAKKSKSSSSGSASSHSPSPRRKGKTPPRGFKDSHHSRSDSKSNSKKSKHRSSHKRKHSRSPSPINSPQHHSSKKSSYKSKHSDKTRVRSRSRSHERNHYSNSNHSSDKLHKSRRDRPKENHHSRDKKKR